MTAIPASAEPPGETRQSSSKPVTTGGRFRFVDLFAGIGGMRRGFDAAGGVCVFTSERDKYARQTYQANFTGRRIGERHRWYPGDPNDWRKAQRHLVRMPVLLLDSFGPDADHLLCGKPSVHSEIREQLTSQQDMFNRTFQRVARALYFDDCAGGLKRGAGGSGAGSPRRLAKVRQQLTVTWELDDLEWTEVLAKLPPEFDRFRPWP